jgi:hypothetical protein
MMAVFFALLAWLAVQAPAATDSLSRFLYVESPSEVVVTVRAGCVGCSWGEAGREAAALRLLVNGKYSQHILLFRGETPSEYRISLGTLSPGRYRLMVERDPALSARAAGRLSIDIPKIEYVVKGRSTDFTAQSMAPILYARPNTVGRFTDVPMLMWYEIVPTQRGLQFRYSVIFSNEDGGTATDRLMATWGRTTDIEFVYGVEVDEHDTVLAEEFQGPGHEVPSFKGRHEGTHPLLWVSTDNNMVSESGTTTVRYAPAAVRYDLTNKSREVVMDRNPWTYTVTAQEMIREGKIADDAAPASGKIPDLRRYVHVEACTELANAAVAFSVRATDDSGAARWYDSDRGVSEFRIVRTDCFRGAVPLPASAGRPTAIRFRAYSRPQKDAATAPGSVVLTRVNTVFTLDGQYQPGPPLFSWVGSIPLPLDGDWHELSFGR